MRICVDARMCRAWDAGTARIVTSLLDEIAELDRSNHYIVLLNPAAPSIPIKKPSRFCLVKSNIPPASLVQSLMLPMWVQRNRVDLIYYTHPLSMAVWEPCRSIATVLDILPVHFPNHFSWGVDHYYRTIVRLGIRTKDAVIAISRHTSQEIIQFLGAQESKMRVIPLAPAKHLRPIPDCPERNAIIAAFGISRPYILYHGNSRPHKNIETLLRAFKIVLEHCGPAYELVITGRDMPSERERDFSSIRQECSKLRIGAHVKFTGYVEERDLASLYSGANVFVFPSLHEAFGLPVIEAMACGTPVVCSNAAALPEVAGDAAILVDPRKEEELAKILLQVLKSEQLRRELSLRGLRRAATFTWHETSKKVLQLFKEIGYGPG